MLSGEKLKKHRQSAGLSVRALAEGIERPGLGARQAHAAVGNWERGLLKPNPKSDDIDGLASLLGVERNQLLVWSACHKYAPMAPRKVRLVADLIRGRYAQEAIDILQFANKRAAVLVKKVLQSAIANADEQEADVSRLFVSEAVVDEGGVRVGTRRWRPKDRGRAVPWTRLASHIRISLDMD